MTPAQEKAILKSVTAFTYEGAGYPINVLRAGKGKFVVIYGKHVREGLDYTAAAHELGECIFHALQCEGKLDDEG